MTPLIECDARLRFKIIRFKTRTKLDLKVRRKRGEEAAIATLDIVKGARAWIDIVKHGVVNDDGTKHNFIINIRLNLKNRVLK